MKGLARLLCVALTLILACNAQAAELTVQRVLRVGVVGPVSGAVNPLFARAVYDDDVMAMTQLRLLTVDRAGEAVLSAIEGETVSYAGADYHYRGPADLSVSYDAQANTTVYRARLREDLRFSDCTPVTADDVLFSLYVYLDASYDGYAAVRDCDIVGLRDYQTQTTGPVYEAYAQLAAEIRSATPAHEPVKSDDFTRLEQLGYWAIERELWTERVGGIVQYCLDHYLPMAEEYTGFTAQEIAADDKLSVAFAMAMWGYGKRDKGFTGSTGQKWTLEGGDCPTVADFYRATYAAHRGDASAFVKADMPDQSATDIAVQVTNTFITLFGAAAVEGGVPNIAGIQKIDAYTVEITTNGYAANDLYRLFGAYIAPLHHYGDRAQYDYAANRFGFTRGELAPLRAKAGRPVGAGRYALTDAGAAVLSFEANAYAYQGLPVIQQVQFVVTEQAGMLAAMQRGEIDIGQPLANALTLDALPDGEETLLTQLVEFPGYGYIGLNADTINVAGEPDSAASKALRRALATIIAVYRDESVANYYGEAATVINYSIPDASFAAPQSTDPDYHVAYAVDAKGNALYDDEMDTDVWYEQALRAAKGLFIQAGYRFSQKTGRCTSAAPGAKLAYTVYVTGDGIGDHPMYAALVNASEALATLGITLTVVDLADADTLWNAQQADLHELWCAAWETGLSPDGYRIWHSDNLPGRGGTNANLVHLDDPELDQLLLDAQRAADPATRSALTRQILDGVLNWAVELPTYARKNCFIFSTERLAADSLPTNMTAGYTWIDAIATLSFIKGA